MKNPDTEKHLHRESSNPETFHIGPGPARVHLKISSNWDIKPLYDVIATLKGSDPDQ